MVRSVRQEFGTKNKCSEGVSETSAEQTSTPAICQSPAVWPLTYRQLHLQTIFNLTFSEVLMGFYQHGGETLSSDLMQSNLRPHLSSRLYYHNLFSLFCPISFIPYTNSLRSYLGYQFLFLSLLIHYSSP